MTDGVVGLLRDKTRRSRIPPLDADVTTRVVSAPLAPMPMPRQDQRECQRRNNLSNFRVLAWIFMPH